MCFPRNVWFKADGQGVTISVAWFRIGFIPKAPSAACGRDISADHTTSLAQASSWLSTFTDSCWLIIPAERGFQHVKCQCWFGTGQPFPAVGQTPHIKVPPEPFALWDMIPHK